MANYLTLLKKLCSAHRLDFNPVITNLSCPVICFSGTTGISSTLVKDIQLFIVSMHVRVHDLAVQKVLIEKIHHLLKEKYSIHFSTIQIEIECPEGDVASEIETKFHANQQLTAE